MLTICIIICSSAENNVLSVPVLRYFWMPGKIARRDMHEHQPAGIDVSPGYNPPCPPLLHPLHPEIHTQGVKSFNFTEVSTAP